MDDRNYSGQTPLHSAVEAGAIDVVRLYVEEGADRSAQDNGGRTPLHLAAEKDNNQDMIRRTNRATPSCSEGRQRTGDRAATRERRRRPLARHRRKNRATSSFSDGKPHKGSPDATRKLRIHPLERPRRTTGTTPAFTQERQRDGDQIAMKHGADIYTCDNTGSPAFPHAEVQLRRAVRSNNQEMVKLLLDRGADGVKGEPSFGQKSLEFAVIGGYFRCRRVICWLAQNDVYLNTANGHKVLVDVMMYGLQGDWESTISKADLSVEIDGKTILYWVVESDHVRLDRVDILLNQGARIDARYMDKTLLSVAAEKKHWDVVKKLVERGADVDVLVGGRTLLIWLLEHYLELPYHEKQQQKDLVEMVLDQNGEYAYVSKTDEEGKTALGHALDARLEDIAVRILEKYPLEEVCDFLYGISRGLSYHTQ
ncbi:ankyrin repeat protein [Ilyonectria robusta]